MWPQAPYSEDLPIASRAMYISWDMDYGDVDLVTHEMPTEPDPISTHSTTRLGELRPRWRIDDDITGGKYFSAGLGLHAATYFAITVSHPTNRIIARINEKTQYSSPPTLHGPLWKHNHTQEEGPSPRQERNKGRRRRLRY